MNYRLSSFGIFPLLLDLADAIGFFSLEGFLNGRIFAPLILLFLFLLSLASPFGLLLPAEALFSYARRLASILFKGILMMNYSVTVGTFCLAREVSRPSFMLILYFSRILAHAAEIPGFFYDSGLSFFPVKAKAPATSPYWPRPPELRLCGSIMRV
jgi:hypothetical protein